MKITGSQICEFLGGVECWRNCEVAPAEVAGFNIDSRKILPGEVFVALKTANRDGHDFLAAAQERGAAGAIVSRFVENSPLPQIVVPDTLEAFQRIARNWRERISGTVVGVTGSVGKTSTKDLLNSIFSAAGATHATYSNLNNTIGVPLTVLGADRDEDLVVEAGMSVPGELDRSAWIIQPDVAVITNVKPAHLEGLGSMENIAREKSALARHLSAHGVVVFPAELLCYTAFKNLRCRRIVVAFDAEAFALAQQAMNEDGGSSIEQIVYARIECRGSRFSIALRNDVLAFELKNASFGLAQNAALAVCAATVAGIPDELVRRALGEWKPSANRGEMHLLADGRRFFVDCYNASPASMLDSAQAFVRYEHESGNIPAKKLFVLGGMGELGSESESLHRGVGEKLPLDPITDTVALFGGNAAQIGTGAVKNGFPPERVLVFSEIEKLRKFVAEFAGDVMVKGSRAFALERVLPALRD